MKRNGMRVNFYGYFNMVKLHSEANEKLKQMQHFSGIFFIIVFLSKIYF